MNFYIRFTENIENDIERGYSIDFRNKSRLPGLCAWVISRDYNPFDDDSIIAAAKETAQQIAKNSYAGYGSASNYAVIEGTYLGSGNDGYVIEVIRVLAELSI